MGFKRIIVYDLETNGFPSEKTQPIEVCLKIIEDGKTEYYHSYINTIDGSNYVPYHITGVNGITKEILDAKGRDFNIVMNELHEIFSKEGNFVIGYNIATFDNRFLEIAFKKIGKAMPKFQFFDCQMEFKAKVAKINRFNGEDRYSFYRRVNGFRAKGAKYKLVDAVNHYGIPKLEAFHGAKADVDYTHEVYLKQRDELTQKK